MNKEIDILKYINTIIELKNKELEKLEYLRETNHYYNEDNLFTVKEYEISSDIREIKGYISGLLNIKNLIETEEIEYIFKEKIIFNKCLNEIEIIFLDKKEIYSFNLKDVLIIKCHIEVDYKVLKIQIKYNEKMSISFLYEKDIDYIYKEILNCYYKEKNDK
jgi:hypothetical protein